MAIESAIVKAKRSLINPKFMTRKMRRCFRCGRNHGYMREFNICRICFRELATKGDLPGIKKASW